MKNSITRTISLLALVPGFTACNHVDEAKQTEPNIVLIFLDDAGWSDFQPFAETRYPTPNVRQLAEEGKTFHNFYVPQAVCSASRAALLTGCYPERVGLFGAHAPRQRGLDAGFATMGELFQEAGYTTGFFGKWHLGDQPDTRPHVRGFDESAGIMYSNDMWADHPENPDFWGQWPLQYWENGEITIDSVTADHQTYFTTWFTEKSVDFINENSRDPFFLYLPHNYRYPLQGGTDGQAGTYIQKSIDTALFDLVHDPYEKVNVIEEYQEMAKQLLQYAEEHKIKFFR